MVHDAIQKWAESHEEAFPAAVSLNAQIANLLHYALINFIHIYCSEFGSSLRQIRRGGARHANETSI